MGKNIAKDRFQVYLSKFRHAERTGEETYFKSWFEHQGYDVFQSEKYFEGGGDAAFCRTDNRLWAGYGFRSDKEVGYTITFPVLDCSTIYAIILEGHA